MLRNLLFYSLITLLFISNLHASSSGPYDNDSNALAEVVHKIELTPADEQYEKFCLLIENKKPDDAFPELLPQFKQNITAIHNSLEGPYTTFFDNLSKSALEFLGPDGQNLTLPRYNVAHLYFATLYGFFQRDTTAYSQHVINNGKDYFTKSFLDALEHASEESHGLSALFGRFDHQRVSPALYIKHGLYPYTILCHDGELSLKSLMNSFSNRVRLCAMPLQIGSFDGELNQEADSFLAHDWGHASPLFNGLLSIDENGLKQYIKLESLIKENPDKKIQNLDYFCLFFIEHEKLLFQRGLIDNFEGSCDDILDKLLNNDLQVLNLCSHMIMGEKAIDLFIRQAPSKNEPFEFNASEFTSYSEASGVLYNSLFAKGYNLLFDIRAFLSASDVDFIIWKDERFNGAEMIATLKKVFDDFKARHTKVLN